MTLSQSCTNAVTGMAETQGCPSIVVKAVDRGGPWGKAPTSCSVKPHGVKNPDFNRRVGVGEIRSCAPNEV